MPLTNAEVVARTLADEGVQYAFGLPGGEVVVLVDALRRAGIRFLLVGHEASAAFMADVTGQITGRPGVCVSTLGPGAANLTTGIASAYLERSPLLALTAQIPQDLYSSFTHQRLPLDRVFAGITKQSLVLDGVDTRAKVEAALRLATSGRPGPVHLALPGDVAAAAPRVSDTSSSTAGLASAAPRVPASGDRAADEARQALQEARRPLLLVGLGARPEDAPAVRHLLDVTHWPWMTTPKAKGIVSELHPRFLGVAGGMALDRVVLETLELSDLIVGIGFDPVECDKPWFVDRRIVNVSRWPTAEGAYRPIEIVGAIGAEVSALAAHLAPQPWPQPLVDERRRAILRSPAPAGPSPAEALSPLAALHALRSVLPEETVVAVDVGSHKLLAGQCWPTTVPHTFFVSNGLSSMGYGLPAAIAASLHFPGRPIAALIGDGGMLMMAHNLPLIASLRLPIVTVVFVDGSLSLIRLAQARRGLLPYGVDFPPPDFTRFASACGIEAARAESLDALKMHAARAVSMRVPCLLEIPVNLHDYEDLI
ncbi:MAG: thiamine pyrophosphate-binding protein [Armatimonadota bacterium]|nr:thiamine pyrophosphate-binding protein [Armatimonadota bacterium]